MNQDQLQLLTSSKLHVIDPECEYSSEEEDFLATPATAVHKENHYIEKTLNTMCSIQLKSKDKALMLGLLTKYPALMQHHFKNNSKKDVTSS